MNPYSRIAYYLSPIVGNNFGTIRNIDCRHTIRESDYTFVGFIGNVCGKENCGDISNCYVDLDMESSRTDEKLAVRNYTDTNNYLPNYEELNSAYSNQINIFGYNYDYCQSPYGTPEDEYSANSASCVKITPRFYSYRDLYQGDPFFPYGVRNSKFSDFIFNEEGETWLHSGNIIRDEFCNFNVRGNETEAIARNIPDKIRKQKLKFRFEKVDSEQADSTGPDDYSIVVRLGSLYTMIKKASYKFYNTSTKRKSGEANCFSRHFLSINSTSYSFVLLISSIRLVVLPMAKRWSVRKSTSHRIWSWASQTTNWRRFSNSVYFRSVR